MAQPYYWWHGSDLADFFAEINRRGSDNVRIEFHPHEGENGLLFIREATGAGIVAQSHEPGGGTNYSHSCPPEC